MWIERSAWAGNSIVAGVAVFLAAVPLAKTTAGWVFYVVGGLMIVATILLFPYAEAGGRKKRLLGALTRDGGTRNRTQVAGANSQQVIADGDVNIGRIGNNQ
ncbi:hypothetical protein [Williamsia muralis]|uniref:Uncharacterized protein n=1 Tax=Williamsia marianensis TaxID=85044 RepID=A0ABU4EW07_WILMA|nr:hypothetical protein [Williamsia muralis]MDV7135414.1 hypothetical protein [Williamsia muralis]